MCFRLEKVTVRMDTFKCIFNSLEELLKQIEEARNIQETSNEKLREACLLNIERDKARTKKMNELRQRLQQLAEKNSLWVNQGLQNMTTSRLVIQQQVSSLNNLMNEHRQQLSNVFFFICYPYQLTFFSCSERKGFFARSKTYFS